MNATKIGEVIFTATTEESVSYENEITERPVEDLGYISDHVRQKPIKFSVSGVLVGEEAFARLMKLREYSKGKMTLSYYGRNAFSNVLIETLETGHNKETRNGFSFHMTCKIVQQAIKKEIIRSQTVDTQVKDVTKQGKITVMQKPVTKKKKESIKQKGAKQAE